MDSVDRNNPVSTQKTLAETLRCPVCYELPKPPVFGCQNGHIICQLCKEHVNHCAVCRSEKFNVHNVVVDEILLAKSLECPYRDDGCYAPKMTGAEYTAHVKICEYRPIECHCKLGGTECHGALFSKNEYMDHMGAHGARLGRSIHIVKCDMEGPFVPTCFTYLGKDFFVMSERDGPKFWTWVAIDSTSDDGLPGFYAKITLRYHNGRQEMTFSSDVFPFVNIRQTPKQVLQSGHCLEFSADTAPPSLPPYVWPGYEEVEEGEGGFFWGYDIEISQSQIRGRHRGRVNRRSDILTEVMNVARVFGAAQRSTNAGFALPPQIPHQMTPTLTGPLGIYANPNSNYNDEMLANMMGSSVAVPNPVQPQNSQLGPVANAFQAIARNQALDDWSDESDSNDDESGENDDILFETAENQQQRGTIRLTDPQNRTKSPPPKRLATNDSTVNVDATASIGVNSEVDQDMTSKPNMISPSVLKSDGASEKN